MSSEKLTSICETTRCHISRTPLSSERNVTVQEAWRLSPACLIFLIVFFSEFRYSVTRENKFWKFKSFVF